MKQNIFKLSLACPSLLYVLNCWANLPTEEMVSKKFVYLADSTSGKVGVCQVTINSEFNNCLELTRSSHNFFNEVDFKSATNMITHNNFMYVTNEYNGYLNVYHINKETGELRKIQYVNGLNMPNGLDIYNNKLFVVNYNKKGSIKAFDIENNGILTNTKDIKITSSYIFSPSSYYLHSIKFYSKQNNASSEEKAMIYITQYTYGSETLGRGLSGAIFGSSYGNALRVCEIKENSNKNIDFDKCKSGQTYPNLFYYPEKLFIYNNIFYSTNYKNQNFTYSKIGEESLEANNDFIITKTNILNFNDKFKVNYIDFLDNNIYLASHGKKIKKCELLNDGSAHPNCNTEIDFSNSPLSGYTFDLIKFVDIK